MTIQVLVQRVRPGDLPLPQYQTALSSGLDLYADVTGPVILQPFERTLVPTGLALQLPAGYEGQIRPRSGLALKSGLTCLNSPGTIDADYRGEVKVLLVNISQVAATIMRGDRIAQLVVAPVTRAELKEVQVLTETERGVGGFGSTGIAVVR
ncbi:MAG: dUTP diphosphatase [Myxococcaceae bacterium]|nr:dUTP diphosphatase [Myxococcaceae bacterium]